MEKKTPALVITCEHASNAVPRFLAQRIAATGEAGIPEEYLYSHRGYDIGAYGVYLRLIRRLHPDFYIAGKYSRLVIDLNRSENHPGLLSKYTQGFKDPTRKRIFEIWQRHHDAVESFIAKTIANSQGQEIDAPRVIHLGIHSFTPVLNNVVRNADVGILYDPARPWETQIATSIIEEIQVRAPELRIRRNYPYLGKSDGLTTSLRKKFGPAYVGIEIEINQKLFLG